MIPQCTPRQRGLGSPPLPVVALTEIAGALAQVEHTVPVSAHDDPARPRSRHLVTTVDYEVWLITWPPGSGSGYHDHDGATSVIHVVSGSLVESIDATRRMLHPATSVVTPPHVPHRLPTRACQRPPASTCTPLRSPPVTQLDRSPPIGVHPARGQRAGQISPVRSPWAECEGCPSPGKDPNRNYLERTRCVDQRVGRSAANRCSAVTSRSTSVQVLYRASDDRTVASSP